MSTTADAPASIGLIRREWRGFWLAVQFFTRLPTPQFEGFRAEWLNDAAKWFPAVGLLVGGLSAAVLWLAAQVFPMPIAAGLALAAGAVVTGAFHEDGLADTFDALGGHVDRAKALVIMKDSRLGSYGALALLLVTGLRWAALAALPLALAIPALVAAHAVARGGATALMAGLADEGAVPVDGGLATTPAMFYAIVAPGAEVQGSVMLTASHMPLQNNGE